MGLYACGLSHHSAPVALRESLAMSQDRTTAFLQQLKHQNVANEVVVLATCNRFEMYVQAPTPDALLPQLARYCDVDIALLKPHWYCHSGQNATEHLMQVVSGIDSMVIGESQISAQVKKAFADAKSAGVLGSHLHYLFERVLSVSKQVRSYTPIGAPVISVAYLVIELAKRFFDDFSQLKAVSFGALAQNALICGFNRRNNPQKNNLFKGEKIDMQLPSINVGGHSRPLNRYLSKGKIEFRGHDIEFKSKMYRVN